MYLTKTFRKNIRRSITGSFGRYCAILLIIMLGVGFLAGLKLTNPVMMRVEENFITDTNLYDYRLISTIGFDAEDINALSKIDGTETAAGSLTYDFLVTSDDEERVYRAHMLTPGVNEPILEAGRMPQEANECLADMSLFSDDVLGQEIVLSSENDEDTIDAFAYDKYTIVGICYSPLYISQERGSTSVGSGSLNGFILIPEDGFSFEYYNEAFIKTHNDFEVYSEQYDDFIDVLTDDVKSVCLESLNGRFDRLYDDAVAEITDAQQELDEKSADALAELNDAKETLDEAWEELEDGRIAIERNEANLNRAKTELDNAKATLDSSAAQMSATASTWEEALAAARTSLNAGRMEIAAQMEQATLLMGPEMAYSMCAEGLAQLSAMEVNINMFEQGMQSYYAGKAQYNSGRVQLNDARETYESGLQEYYDGLDEYESGLEEYEQEIADAQTEIDDAWKELEDLKSPELFILDRTSNTGYATFRNDAGIVNNLSSLLPVFFFLIAALVCSTTMNRMIDDDRSQIGTMCALGYGRREIYAKYSVYSGSAAIIGGVIGYFGGGYLFPKVIWIAYRLLYRIPGYEIIYSVKYFVISMVLALLCSVGVTIVTLKAELKNMPAELIRPKAPAAGKRILLEKITFVWRRLKFLHKVTVRNIFRYKKRMIMMVLGIAGCTGLVITGFGIKDSVADIGNYQYREIMQYDLSVVTTDTVDQEMLDKVRAACGDDFDLYACAQTTAVDVTGTDGTKSVNVIASDDENMSQVIHLALDGTKVEFPAAFRETVVSEKLCSLVGIKLGGTATLTVSDTNRPDVKVVNCVDNYVFNYMYMSSDTYADIFDVYEPQTIYIKLNTLEHDSEIGAEIMNIDGVASVTVVSVFKSMIDKMMRSLNYVVALVIFSAAALALVVLFNLGNINISERVREIATIKVLGFHLSETAAYVFRENLLLTVMGIVVGIPIGLLLHRFVMDQIKVDMVSFKVLVYPASIAFSVVFVLLCAIFTNLILNRKIRAIDMAESLKSVE